MQTYHNRFMSASNPTRVHVFFALSKLRVLLLLPLLSLFWLPSCSDKTPPRILIFSKTAGYRHACIPTATAALRQMCYQNGIAVDTTEEAEDFTENNLKRYNAVVFLCTTGDVLSPTQEADFERYIQAGGGFAGIHSATDTEYGWGWFGGLVGAYFNGHPEQQNATLHVKNHEHAATKHLKGDDWVRFDEWYSFKNLNPNTNVLLTIDETTYKGGTNGDNHPMSWYHEYDGGRSFYTALGHTNESYAEPDFMKHVLGGIQYAIGKQKRLNYTACRTPEQPDPTRFVKTVIANELTEPMELDMFPNGKIIFIERRGNIKLFNPTTGLITIAHRLPVYSEQEDGLMGLAIDPNYAENNWIYLYYSSVGNQSFNTLSRFVFRGDSLDRASEKIILQVAVQRQECCHTGGCIEFDAEGNLFLSTGDNTNPFDSRGYSPSDERPGRSPWDAQKSSANTNDLRGKILRIKPLPDGSYICPAGNLFNQNAVTLQWGSPESKQMTTNSQQQSGRPEIYVMGCRNPYRLSIDSRRKLLFWGEVGPDAGEPDSTRGPAGHDEVNRARAAGFFGWPYFVGNNKPYREHDFASQQSGNPFDPLHPINNSPNNTGSRELPPAQPAFIWYPYGNSPEFPLLGNGGRNAMAGPVYYCDQYPEATRLPDYYDGKLITYDWMRNWMMAVTIDSSGNFSRMENFADSLRFSRPMDMIVDKNGTIWLLEYGTQWFSSNIDARLSRIDYVRGNRPPIPSFKVNKKAGSAPLEVVFTASGTKDYDKDRLQFQIDFGDETTWKSDFMRVPSLQAGLDANAKSLKKNPLDSISHVYQKPGNYEAILRVTDPSGAFKTARIKINVGNEPPVVHWNFGGKNRSFYQPGDVLNYQLLVEDAEDGSLQSGRILSEAVATTIDYLETGFDITSIAQGHQAAMKQAEYAKGKILTERSDCKTCHAIDRKVNGPAYQEIAERYRGDEFAVRNLSRKVINGGSGVWGETAMSAHPQLSPEDVGEMVRWILSLGAVAKPKQTMPPSGSYALVTPAAQHGKPAAPGTYIFKASYQDKGSGTQGSLESGEVLALRPAFQQAEQADSLSNGIINFRPFGGDTVLLKELKNKSFIMYKHTDMTGIHAIAVGVGLGDGLNKFAGGRIEIRLDAPNGALLGKADIKAKNTARMEFAEINVPIKHISDGKFHDLYLVFRNDQVASDQITALDWVRFDMMVN